MRAWCAQCFRVARERREPAHLPLIWSLAGFERCHIHKCVLEFVCPCCQRSSAPWHSWKSHLDHCPQCGKDLAASSAGAALTFRELSRRTDEQIDLFMSELIAEFVATPWATMPDRGFPNAKKAIMHAIDQGYSRNAKALARNSGLTPTTLVTLQKPDRTVSLEVLARLAAAARVSIAGLLDDALWREFPERVPPAALAERPRVRTRRTHDWSQITPHIVQAIDKGEVASLRGASRRLGMDQSYLATRLDVETRTQLVAKAVLVRKQRAAANLEELCRRIAAARTSLLQAGDRASARAIGARIGMDPSGPRFRNALARVRQEESTA
jgi:transcriptional regulator with XRE-family HTH domain